MENTHQNDEIENTLPSISLPVHGPTHAKRNDCRRWKMLADLKKKKIAIRRLCPQPLEILS